MKMNKRSKLILFLILALALLLAVVVFYSSGRSNSAPETAISKTDHEQITLEMISMLDDDLGQKPRVAVH